MNKILFICTGNFYRSRFCEGLFNFLSRKQGLGWEAFSRGLDVQTADKASVIHHGEVSKDTKAKLKELGISLGHIGQKRTPLVIADLENSDLIYAMMESEHRPMIKEQFPGWEDRVEYWNIGDMPHNWTASQTLGLAEIMVVDLVENNILVNKPTSL